MASGNSKARKREYCCLSKIGQCNTRIEPGKARVYLTNSKVKKFPEFVGEENADLFDAQDFLCQKHAMQVRRLDPTFRKRGGEGSGISQPLLKIFRSGKEITVSDAGRKSSILEEQGHGGQEDHNSDDPFGLFESSQVLNHRIEEDSGSIPASALASTLGTSQESFIPASALASTLGTSQESFTFSLGPPMSITSSQTSVLSCASSTRRQIPSPIKRGESVIVLPGVPSSSSSQKVCCICKSRSGRTRVPFSAIVDAYCKKRLVIPIGNRTCLEHLEDGYFKEEALLKLVGKRLDTEITGKDAAKLLIAVTNRTSFGRKVISFDLDSGLSDEDYSMLIGFPCAVFDDLVTLLNGRMRNTKSRSIRNALGIFLMKIRLNVSQTVLSFLFGTYGQSSISETIDTVSEILETELVPKYLGYQHLTREEMMSHVLPMYQKILGLNEDDLVLILDGTYLYLEKSSDHLIQKRTYSAHKHRNLVKAMTVTFPDGYLYNIDRQYFSDGSNNDAKILEHMLRKDDSFVSILQTNDCFVLDRGFDRVKDLVEDSGIKVVIPAMLSKQGSGNTQGNSESQTPSSSRRQPKEKRQFSTAEANSTRRVTKLRWVVEAAHGRIKLIFRFFQDVIPATYIPKINRFLGIAAAMVNKYCDPLVKGETECHRRITEAILNHDNEENKLQEKVVRLKLDKISWKKEWDISEDGSLPEFPELSEEDLLMITLGPYQLEQGKLYNERHLQGGGGYRFYVHKEEPGLIRVRMKSRFSKTESHLLWIEFEEFGSGRNAIKGYYCRCESGARTLGCCSHIAGVLRYLGLDRFVTQVQKPDLARFFLDAAETFANEEGSDEEEV